MSDMKTEKALKLIDFYQKKISPMKKPCCRFYPSCSEYTKLAIQKYGLGKGTAMGIKRISRCHKPNGGIDFP